MTPPEVDYDNKRSKIVEELIQNERSYVSVLQGLVDHFLIPLKEVEILPARTRKICFPSFLQTILGVHTDFLKKLGKLASLVSAPAALFYRLFRE